MKWEDEGMLLSSRNYGEHSAIIEVLTRSHGRHAGLVKYAHSKRNASILQPGMQLRVAWNARLSEHLGVFTIDKVKSRTSDLIQTKQTLLGFNSLISLLLISLPEREPVLRLYQATISLVDAMKEDKKWLVGYVHWELLILAELGFGLDLSKCAVTGKSVDLIYVSPKSGRAVSAKAGKKWEKNLLPLPHFLTLEHNEVETDSKMVSRGMILTGYFLEKWSQDNLEKKSLPRARHRFFLTLND